jgi:hypothetical protein
VSISKAVIFCSTKKRAEELKAKLVREKFTVSCIVSPPLSISLCPIINGIPSAISAQ